MASDIHFAQKGANHILTRQKRASNIYLFKKANHILIKTKKTRNIHFVQKEKLYTDQDKRHFVQKGVTTILIKRKEGQ